MRCDFHGSASPITKYKWNEVSQTLFWNYMQENTIKGEIHDMQNCMESLDIDEACTQLSQLLTEAADISCSQTQVKPGKKKIFAPVISDDLQNKLKSTKHNFYRALNNFNADRGNLSRRHKLINQRNTTKKLST